MTKVIYPDEGEVELEYDRLGRMVSRTDQRGCRNGVGYRVRSCCSELPIVIGTVDDGAPAAGVGRVTRRQE